MKFIKIELLFNPFSRFLLAGATNTVLTYFTYLIGLIFFHYLIAYSCSYAVGIIISYYLNSRFVFQVSISLVKAFSFILTYAIQYLLGVAILYITVGLWHLDKIVAPFIVVAIMVPISFLLNKLILQEQKCA